MCTQRSTMMVCGVAVGRACSEQAHLQEKINWYRAEIDGDGR
jgi:hypothetical protein